MKKFSTRNSSTRGIANKISVFALAAFFVLMTSSLAFGQTIIAGYDVTGPSGSPVTAPATTTSTNVVASSITRGTGAPASTGTNSFRTTGFRNDGISTANTDYFQVQLSATTGNTLSLSAIDANLAGTPTFVAAPGATIQFAYSLDGTNFTLIGSPQTVVGTPQAITTIDLTGITALQRVASGTTVTLRFYASGQTATGGFGFFSPSAGTNGLAISGTTAPAGTTAATVSVGGRVTGSKNRGIPGAIVVMTDGNGLMRSAVTDEEGNYRFEAVEVGQVLLFEVRAKRYFFAQPLQVVSLTDEVLTVDFNGSSARIF